MDEKFVCKYCGKEFDDAAKLRGHNMTCRPPQEEQGEPSERYKAERERDEFKRVPVGLPRQKLSFPAEKYPDKVFRVVNDNGNRIVRFLNGGYWFVPESMEKWGDSETRSDGSQAQSMYVGKHKDGSPMRGYLMMIDKELYDEDQKAKHKRIDEIEAQIMRGVDAQGQPGRDGRYVPTSGISIEHGG